MKKLSLLVLAGLAAMGTASAKFYVIQDGKVVNGVEMAYDGAAAGEFDTFNQEITAPDGSKAAQYVHNAAYKEIRLDFTKGAMPNIQEDYMLCVEYAVGADGIDVSADMFSYVDGAKPIFSFGMWDKTILELNEDGTKKEIGMDKAEAKVNVNAIFGMEADKFKTDYSFIFANPSFKEVGVLMISAVREYAAQYDEFYIKNMWFDNPGTAKPFYAENFEVVGENSVLHYTNTSLKDFVESDMAGGYAITSVGKAAQGRSWNKEGTDAPYLDSEFIHYLQVEDYTTAKCSETKLKEIQVKDIEIPAGNSGKLYAGAIVKFEWNEAIAPSFDEAFAAGTAKVPAYAIFNDADSTKIALFGDSILPYNFTLLKNEIAIPSGATKVTLSFEHSDFPYAVDDLMLSIFNNVENEDVVVLPTSKAVIYVANDEVVSPNAEKIEIISLAGAVVASANEASVNIAALPAGVYVVKVANAEGISVAKIIKK